MTTNGNTRREITPRRRGSPKRDYLGSNGRRTGRKGRAMGELPDSGKFRRRFRRDQRCDLRLGQRNFNHRGKQGEEEQRLGRGDSQFFSPVIPALNDARVAFAIRRAGSPCIHEATSLEEIETGNALQNAVH